MVSDWLFPQMACIVHHDGTGISAATFRAGIPGITMPFLGKQPFWSDRVELGASPAPIDRQTMTVDSLAAAISEAVTNQEMRGRAVKLGTQIQSEDGVARAESFNFKIDIELCFGLSREVQRLSAVELRV